MRVAIFAVAALALLPGRARAQPLTVVEVSAPKINCVFNATFQHSGIRSLEFT